MDMCNNALPRDKFALMLLERVDNLEDELETMRRVMKEQKEQLEHLRHDRRGDFLRYILMIYKSMYSNNRDDPHYYMRAFAESLEQWWHQRKPYPVPLHSAGAIDTLMKTHTNNFDTPSARVAGNIILSMGDSDYNNFLLWDEVPDLVADET